MHAAPAGGTLWPGKDPNIDFVPWTVVGIDPKHIKGAKECLFIMTRTNNVHLFGVIPFVKSSNKTTLKQQLNG